MACNAMIVARGPPPRIYLAKPMEALSTIPLVLASHLSRRPMRWRVRCAQRSGRAL